MYHNKVRAYFFGCLLIGIYCVLQQFSESLNIGITQYWFSRISYIFASDTKLILRKLTESDMKIPSITITEYNEKH